MTPLQLFKLAGAAASAGGGLRIIASFALHADAVTLEWLYTTIDVLLLFGLMGIYFVRAERLRLLGMTSFAVAVAALSFIGGPDADTLGFSTHEQGAAVLLIALVALSLAWLRAGERPYAPPLCWFASAIAAGVLSALPAPLSDYGVIAARILFGAGFVFAGLDLLRRA